MSKGDDNPGRVPYVLLALVLSLVGFAFVLRLVFIPYTAP